MAQQRPGGVGDRGLATDPLTDCPAGAVRGQSEEGLGAAAAEAGSAQYLLDLCTSGLRPKLRRLQAFRPDLKADVHVH
eukprot:24045-Eustigmatos_ZCMA.PRE.1